MPDNMGLPPGVTSRDIDGPPMLRCDACWIEHNGNIDHDQDCDCEECQLCPDCFDKLTHVMVGRAVRRCPTCDHPEHDGYLYRSDAEQRAAGYPRHHRRCPVCMAAFVTWSAPNDPSSATAATERNDCNQSGPPPFAAAHG